MVRIDSKNNEDEQYIWESAAGVSFTVQNDTEIDTGGQARHEDHLFHEEDQSALLEERRLKDLVKEFFEFFGFPIELFVEKLKEIEVSVSEEDEEEQTRWKVRRVMSPNSRMLMTRKKRGAEEENEEDEGGVPRVGEQGR